MDLVLKDIGIFQEVANRANVPLEINPMMIDIFKDGIEKYGARELSPNIIRRLEDKTGLDIRASGFPAEMTDDEPEEVGFEEGKSYLCRKSDFFSESKKTSQRTSPVISRESSASEGLSSASVIPEGHQPIDPELMKRILF